MPDFTFAINTISGTPDSPVVEDSITSDAALIDLEVITSIYQVATCRFTLDKTAFVSTLDEQYMLDCYMGYDGSNVRVFFGDQDEVNFDGEGRALCASVGFLGRLDQPWGGGEYTYSTADDPTLLASAIRRNWIEKSALPSTLHEIAESTWDPTIPNAIVIDDRDVLLERLRALCDQELWWLAEHSNGAIYSYPIAIGSPVASFNDSTSEVRITRNRNRRGLRNKIIVTGMRDSIGIELVSEASASSPFILPPQDYWVKDLNFPLIQDQTQADVISARALEIYNVRPEKGTVTDLINNNVQPGDTISLTSSYCDLSSVSVFVESVAYRAPGVREINWWRFPA